MEAKFAEDPSGSMSSSQYETHIRDLARAYDMVPDGEFLAGAPQYVLVTNSGFEDIGYLGSNYSVRLPSYAAARNVNVMHLRVTKDHQEQHYLEGDHMGTPVNILTWISSFLTGVKVPFRVECDPPQ